MNEVSYSPATEKEFAEAIDAMGHASGAVSELVTMCLPCDVCFRLKGCQLQSPHTTS